MLFDTFRTIFASRSVNIQTNSNWSKHGRHLLYISVVLFIIKFHPSFRTRNRTPIPISTPTQNPAHKRNDSLATQTTTPIYSISLSTLLSMPLLLCIRLIPRFPILHTLHQRRAIKNRIPIYLLAISLLFLLLHPLPLPPHIPYHNKIHIHAPIENHKKVIHT